METWRYLPPCSGSSGNSSSTESQKYTSESLEEKLRSQYFYKVFDNSLSDEEYRQLLVFANLNVEKTWSKEKYEIKVADEVSNSELCCICIPTLSSDENHYSPQKQDQPGVLEIRKNLYDLNPSLSQNSCIQLLSSKKNSKISGHASAMCTLTTM